MPDTELPKPGVLSRVGAVQRAQLSLKVSGFLLRRLSQPLSCHKHQRNLDFICCCCHAVVGARNRIAQTWLTLSSRGRAKCTTQLGGKWFLTASPIPTAYLPLTSTEFEFYLLLLPCRFRCQTPNCPKLAHTLESGQCKGHDSAWG